MNKKYLSEMLSPEIYSKWTHGGKIIIQAPTGMGKNHFIIKVFAPYCRQFGKKF
mgnify:CR=1 FL=1